MKKETAIVICPGRGTYNQTESGYLAKHHKLDGDFVSEVDLYRKTQHQIPVSELDSEPWKLNLHGTGDNASALIYACALSDFRAIDRERFEIVAVAGNSMGWYLALACAGALNPRNAIHLINTMGTMMHKEGAGGQVVYPLVDETWQRDEEKVQLVHRVMEESRLDPQMQVAISIELGGMVVFAADDAGIRYLMKRLPPEGGRFPMKLVHHAAFHSPLLKAISEKARKALPEELFQTGNIPMIDGRGHIWQPYSTSICALHEYTLRHQVVETYDFTRSVEVAVKEFAPDKILILGPGSTLGAPVAQALIGIGWEGLNHRQDFEQRQRENPFILSMGREEQRHKVTV